MALDDTIYKTTQELRWQSVEQIYGDLNIERLFLGVFKFLVVTNVLLVTGLLNSNPRCISH